MDRKKLFDRAYSKASQMEPGDPDPLTPLERAELLRRIENYKERKRRAFEAFCQKALEKGIEAEPGELKIWFNQLWSEREG